MGSGTIRAGRFNLILSLRHNAAAACLAEWRASFERASQLLFDATDGQHQFGDIYVCNDSSGGHNADAWLLDADGISVSAVHGLGSDTSHMTLCADERYKPFIIIHEFGHYGYGLYDEYTGPAGSAECIGGSTSDACAMEVGWPEGDRFGDLATGGALVLGRVSEFCVASNHDPDGDTNQDTFHGVSCWETMVNNYPDLALPADVPVAADPGGAAAINWIELLAEQRFVLVLDRSGSMSGNKLTEACYGADWWADHAVVGDHLGIVSYSNVITADFPLRQILGDPDRTDAQTAVAAISAGGTTSIGGGLREALNQILAAGARAATQVVVLLTDGLQNTGEHPDIVLPDLAANGVRVYVIGIGSTINATLLGDIADITGGSFYRIDPLLSLADQEFQIRTCLEEISGIARDNGGLVTTLPEKIERRDVLERRVFIEPGSQMATFAISWKDPSDLLFLELMSPSGSHITLGSGVSGVRSLYSQRPYMGYQIEKPEAGEWLLVIKPERVSGEGQFQVLVFSQNPAIDGGLSSPWRQYKPGDIIPLHLHVYFNRPLTGLQVTGTVRLPGGKKLPLEFSDEGRKDLGDVLAADGVYSTLIGTTHTPGIYTVDVVVESDGRSVAYATAGERPVQGEKYSYDPIPAFRRQFTCTVRVGDEPRRSVRITPDKGQRGEELVVEIKGTHTHFRPHDTVVNFGEGIRAGKVEVLDKETARVSVFVERQARSGPREVMVVTPFYHEAVEADNAFLVIVQKRILSRGRIERLVYDRTGRFVGIRAAGQPDVVPTPGEMESLLKEAFTGRLDVALVIDADAGDLDGVEIG